MHHEEVKEDKWMTQKLEMTCVEENEEEVEEDQWMR